MSSGWEKQPTTRGALSLLRPPACRGGRRAGRDGGGEVAPAVEALRWWWLWRQRRRKGGLHAREGRWDGCLRAMGSATGLCRGEVSCTVKDEEGKKWE